MDPMLSDFNFDPSQDNNSGEGSKEGGTAEAKNKTKAKTNKLNCAICKKTTKNVHANKDGGVRCGVCQYWWHPKCLNMDPDLLKWIEMGEKLGNNCCWTCNHCQEAHLKTEQVLKAMSSRMKSVEEKVDKFETRQEQFENKQELIVVKQDKVNTEFDERLKKLELNTGSKVMSEIDERMDKSNNLVIHRIPESNSNDSSEREAHDNAFINVLMDKYLNIKGMDTDNKVKFIRRLGKKGEGDVARPALVGLRFTADLELVLDRSWMLAQSKNSTAEQINIVRDLTTKQRQREADMVREAGRKNLERGAEELEQNFVYKVVGRKGEKREIKVPLRHGEVVDHEGLVTREPGMGRGNRGGRPSMTLATGGNKEPIGQPGTSQVLQAAQPKQAVPVKSVEKKKERTPNKKVVENVSGDWEPASGKRGRPSPSPDKIVKRVKEGGVLELKNKFQKLAESIFGEEVTV